MSADPSTPPALLITPMPDGSWRVEVTNGRGPTTELSVPTAERLLTSKEEAALLGIGDVKLESMAARGEVPCVRIGKALRFRHSEVLVALKERKR